MTTTQIQSKVKSQIKKQYVKKNEIINWNVSGNNEFGIIKVTMPSTCESNETMTWEFTYSFEQGNINEFTDVEILKYPEMITEDKLTIEAI